MAACKAPRGALSVARATAADDLLLVLLSGGGSALMAMPAQGLTLADKQATVRTLLAEGADIYELNTVRKHLSAIKGGLLAAAAPGRTLTLAVSDVVGDDLSFIASGPTVPDESTHQQALDVLMRRGGRAAFPSAVVARLEDGVKGVVAETPATGDPRLARASAVVIGGQRGALEDASRVAEGLGYRVIVVPEPVTGEAREAAVAHVRRVAGLAGAADQPTCVLSSGETTVTVRGRGRGGRNQEFALRGRTASGDDRSIGGARQPGHRRHRRPDRRRRGGGRQLDARARRRAWTSSRDVPA
jgi:glycerate-2-kinase